MYQSNTLYPLNLHVICQIYSVKKNPFISLTDSLSMDYVFRLALRYGANKMASCHAHPFLRAQVFKCIQGATGILNVVTVGHRAP